MLGEFRVEGVLGQGGSGIVFDATWGPRRVALKVLHPSLVGTGKERAQFLTEAQRLQQIMHPSVVKVLAVGELPDGRPYLAMERLEGETLAHVIARRGSGPAHDRALPLAQALEMFGELCSAVAALHAQGLVHRDLKPENVFVVANKHAVLLDFGIAKDLAAPASTTTQEGNVRGTPAYMAPERFFGQPAGIATDIYELALVLYMMLAGRLPWDDAVDPESRLAPRPLVDLAPVPEALDVEIRRALSTRAQNRPASATALLEAVTAAASSAAMEPTAAETARLRSGAQATQSGDQHTPLAWAPTQPAKPTDAARARRRWPIVIGIGGVAIAGGVVAWLRLHERPTPKAHDTTLAVVPVAMRDAGPSEFSKSDPWGERVAEQTSTSKVFPLVEDKATPAQYRSEAAAAVQMLPANTHLVFTTQLTDLRANSQTSDLLTKLASHPKLKMAAAMLPDCVTSLLADSEWLVFGSAGLAAASEAGTLILRGRWRRADVEACFGDAVRTHTALDGAKLFRVAEAGWLDFLDDHTAYVALNAKLAAERVHALVTKPPGPAPGVRQLVAKLPAERSITLVADARSGDDWSAISLPKGTDVFGWVRVDTAGVVFDLAADPHDVRAAQAAIDRVKPNIDEVFAGTSSEAVGKIEAVRDKSVAHIKGNMTSFMLGIVAGSLSL